MKPVATEKAVMMIESANVLTFEVDRRKSKDKVKQEIEGMFGVKVDKVRSLIKGNKKYVYVKLKQDFPAMDIATKLGLM
jgi:large subunit ribosomal protein L23